MVCCRGVTVYVASFEIGLPVVTILLALVDLGLFDL